MKKNTFTKNPYILFSPFLIIYVIYILVVQQNIFIGDENRYIYYAQNLIQGYYSPPPPEIWLDKGPGYSILLVPFVKLNIPYLFIKLLNAVFLYLSLVLLFKVLTKIAHRILSLAACVFWGFYINSFENIQYILPETFSTFLVVLFIFLNINLFNKKKISYLRLTFSGFILGFLALTKVIFSYVIVTLIVIWIIQLLSRKNSAPNIRVMLLLAMSFLTLSPYLVYTYTLTGKFFYLSNVGGNNLYWMSTPYENEYGNWFPFHQLDIDSALLQENPILEINTKYNHKKDHEYFLKLKGSEQDEAYKEVAIRNIKNHPKKFLENCFSNAGRLLFNFPYSYSFQKPQTLFRLPFNGIISVFSLILLLPTILNWKKIPLDIRFLLLFTCIYLGGSLLGSAETRMFTIIVPVLIYWIIYMLNKTITFKLLFSKGEQ
ncbi:ArnT family glycosyltransferase [Saccharicrinis sp. FJH54]|uniref:ArnT family glycosyltransferase n=1 Tax=Saccharicrinis sp. FJH54 TaxID=3344665 RepID=UPI0035D40783